jgi:hypothetical protein
VLPKVYAFNSVARQWKHESVAAHTKVPGFIDTLAILPQSVADRGVADVAPAARKVRDLDL